MTNVIDVLLSIVSICDSNIGNDEHYIQQCNSMIWLVKRFCDICNWCTSKYGDKQNCNNQNLTDIFSMIVLQIRLGCYIEHQC